MKPHTFFRIALFTPFILWGLCMLVVIPISASSAELSETWAAILFPAFFYTIGILLWFFPYTILAIALWIWSVNRTVAALRNAALIAPILFSILMILGTGLVYLLTNDLAGFAEDALSIVAVFGILSMVFGYFCVGIAFGAFKIAQTRNMIVIPQASTTVTD